MSRRAPSGGYRFQEKERYRREVWSVFQRYAPPSSCGNAGIMLMPSLEGLEIEEALGRGYAQKMLHAVDFNPAIVATLKKRYREISTYGVSVDRAFGRMRDNGVALSGANFDLTGNFSWRIVQQMMRVNDSGVFNDGAVVAITLLRGRESPRAFELCDLMGRDIRLRDFAQSIRHVAINRTQLSRIDTWRLGVPVISLHSYRPTPLRTAIYASPQSGLTMLWGMFRLTKVSALVERLLRFQSEVEDVCSSYKAISCLSGAERRRATQLLQDCRQSAHDMTNITAWAETIASCADVLEEWDLATAVAE